MIEVDIEQGRFLLPEPRESKVKYIYFDKNGDMEIQENEYPSDIKCMDFSRFGNDTVEDVMGDIYKVANEFNVKKIVYRTRPLNFKDVPNMISNSGISAGCVCYLIVEGSVCV